MDDIGSERNFQGLEEEEEEGSPEVLLQSEDVLENADISFEVEGNTLKANKACLCMVSPVFKAMFKGDFKESGESDIPLPGKKYDDILELIEVTHIGKAVDDDSVEILLPLADEYVCKSLVVQCDKVLLNQVASFKNLQLSTRYGLHELQSQCATQLAYTTFNSIRYNQEYRDLCAEGKVTYLKEKLVDMEDEIVELKNAKGTADKVENIISTSLTNVICSATALQQFRAQQGMNWSTFTFDSPHRKGLAGDHIA